MIYHLSRGRAGIGWPVLIGSGGWGRNRTDAINARTYLLGLRDRIQNGHQFVPVAVAVDMRKPYGQLMAESRENGFDNWTLVGIGGNEMPLLAAGLTMMCGQWPAPITKVLGISPRT